MGREEISAVDPFADAKPRLSTLTRRERLMSALRGGDESEAQG
jgi:hypothetical protein